MAMNRRRFLQAAGVGAAGLGMTRAGWAFHDDGRPLRQPTYGDIEGLEILGFNDMRLPGQPRTPGWDQSYEFRVIDQGRGRFAYVGNGGRGWSIVDVTNPRNMRVVWRQPHVNPSTDNTQYIDIKGGNILVVKRNHSLETWDVSNPAAPNKVGVFAPDDFHMDESAPFHGLWIHEDSRGRFAFAAFMPEGFSDHILIVANITNPRMPVEAGRWWYPGMRFDETPTWTSPGAASLGLPAPTVMCHDMTTWADRCYVAWRDKGLIILDINNLSNMQKVGEMNWGTDQENRPTFDPVVQIPAGYPPFAATIPVPPLPGQTHSWGMVNPKRGRRVETIVGTDELGQCPFGYMHFIDVKNESRPTEISGFRTPLNMHANCPKDRLGNRMGTHDMERYIRGNIVWSAWEEGGFWGVDFSDIHYPKHAGFYVPPFRSQSARQTGHADDVYVMEDGTIFGSSSDAGAGGLWAMKYKKGFRGTVRWNADESNVIVTKTKGGKNDRDDRDRDDD